MFAYPKKYPRSRLIFDDTEPDYSGIDFHHCDWAEYYPDAADVLLKKIPKSRGCKATRRLHTGIILMENRSSIYGTTATDMIEGLCYKLHMLGVPIDGETH
eukprot:10960830-Ditylum_brightwellii.AAC.1